MAKAADDVVASWQPGATVDARDAAQTITLQIIVRAVFGIEDDKRCDEYVHVVKAMMRNYIAPFMFFPALRRGRAPFGLGPWRRFSEKRIRLDEMLSEQIAARRSTGTGMIYDVLSVLLADAPVVAATTKFNSSCAHCWGPATRRRRRPLPGHSSTFMPTTPFGARFWRNWATIHPGADAEASVPQCRDLRDLAHASNGFHRGAPVDVSCRHMANLAKRRRRPWRSVACPARRPTGVTTPDGSTRNVSLPASPRLPSIRHSATDIVAVRGRRSRHWSWRLRWGPFSPKPRAASDARVSTPAVHPTRRRRGAE